MNAGCVQAEAQKKKSLDRVKVKKQAGLQSAKETLKQAGIRRSSRNTQGKG